MNSKTKEVISKFQEKRITTFKNEKTEVHFTKYDGKSLNISIHRPSGKIEPFNISIEVLDNAVTACVHEKRLLSVSEFHKHPDVGSWQESPVWAVLSLMDTDFWKTSH